MVKKKRKFKSPLTEVNWVGGSTRGLMTIRANRLMEATGLKKKKR